MSQTVVFPDQQSTLAAIGLRPFLMDGYLMAQLRQHFGSSTNIENEVLRSLLWQKSLADSSINIDLIYNWRPERTEHRPAILIKRNDWQLRPGAIDNRAHGSQQIDGVRHFTSFVDGSHTIFCLSSQPAEADLLGMEVALELLQFASHIREEMCLHRFRMVQCGSLFQIQEAREIYAVPVTVAYTAEERWRVLQYAPVLKRIAISYFTNGR